MTPTVGSNSMKVGVKAPHEARGEHRQDAHGHPVPGGGHEHDHEHSAHEHSLESSELARIAFVGVAILAVWFRVWEPLAQVSIIGVAATAIGGWPIFREAVENLRQRRMTMELSMTIALVAALLIGEFVTTLVIIVFVLIAEVLEGLTVGRGRRAIKDLLDLLPQSATVRRAGGTAEVSADDIRVGDLVLVKPGSRLPVDGVVVAGHSAVDQSAITGESMPADKAPGDGVYAGTINQSGALEVRVSGIGKDTAFGRIIEAVERAERLRAPIQKTADRLAGYLVYFALACAVITFVISMYIVGRDFGTTIRATISVVIVAGACGIAAGTPLAILGAVGRSARNGAIIKGGVYLDALGLVDTVVFDKTGTLTLGTPRVTGLRTAPGVSARALLEAAATAESRSEHAIAKAVLDRTREAGVPVVEPQDFRYTLGKGVACQGGAEEIVVGNRAFFAERGLGTHEIPPCDDGISEILVARGGRVLGAIGIADVVRPESARAVGELRQKGLHTVLLTGDAEGIAEAIGRDLGVDEIHGDLLPHQKVGHIRSLRAQGHRVAMVGDGINDAPALMEAHVGVGMGSGTDVARESADVVLIGNDLLRFSETVGIARWCRRIILTNFTGTLAVDGIGVGLAAFGYLNPLLAALIHVVSELVFILNSARLLPPARGT